MCRQRALKPFARSAGLYYQAAIYKSFDRNSHVILYSKDVIPVCEELFEVRDYATTTFVFELGPQTNARVLARWGNSTVHVNMHGVSLCTTVCVVQTYKELDKKKQCSYLFGFKHYLQKPKKPGQSTSARNTCAQQQTPYEKKRVKYWKTPGKVCIPAKWLISGRSLSRFQ